MQEGYYDTFITRHLQEQLKAHLNAIFSTEPLGKEAFWQEFPSHFASEIVNYLKIHAEQIKEKDLYTHIRELLTSSDFLRYIGNSVVPTTGKKLLAIPSEPALQDHTIAPDTPLSVSALLTGAMRTPKLVEQIKKELATCDRADWMVSFIKMTGINPLKEALLDFTLKHRNDASPCLRIATTTYMGVTESKAIEWLQKLPNTEVRISYDTKHTRLHAKTYIFHRNTGYGSAYVGSSNISKVAMDNGLEWNIKVSQRELHHLWEACIAAFDTHWEDTKTFEPCAKEEDIVRLKRALAFERKEESADTAMPFFTLTPFQYQEEALESITREREAGKKKHLIIAATGTGKTMIAAFDYLDFCKRHPNATLLFLAHRQEILLQARSAFRQVTKRSSFGCIVDGKNEPTNNTHWFCTITTWNKYKELFPANHFQYIVVDEAHHGAAASYREALEDRNPESLLGLTATPERMDGNDIKILFGGCYTHELRLGDAIDRTLLSPFTYYGISDESGVNYQNLKFESGKYDIRELGHLLSRNTKRAAWVLSQMDEHLDNLHKIKCIGFCVNIEHAEFMSNYFNNHGIPSLALSSNSSTNERENAKDKLLHGDINIIFTVDLYNEGVDIPDIDTVLFLRPTESITVFLQQLGRGLRKTPDKECLVVMDFIAPAHRKFNYLNRFNALSLKKGAKAIENQIEYGFTYLPAGCLIHLDKQSQEHILHNIKDVLASMTKNKMMHEIQAHAPQGCRYSLTELLDLLGLESPDELYSRLLPCTVQSPQAKKELEGYEKNLQDGMRKLLLQNDGSLLNRVADCLRTPKNFDIEALSSFYKVLWGEKKPADTLRALHQYTLNSSGLTTDILELIEWMQIRRCIFNHSQHIATGYLQIHASYTREQIMLALGLGSFEKSHTCREGVLHIEDRKIHVFFADIHKDERLFSPTTLYEDYAISPTIFHWQSQSNTAPHSKIGQSYIKHKDLGYTILLFIRNNKKTTEGISAPYVFLGPVEYIKHAGSKPISFHWSVCHPIPAHIMAWARN